MKKDEWNVSKTSKQLVDNIYLRLRTFILVRLIDVAVLEFEDNEARNAIFFLIILALNENCLREH